MKVLRTIRFDVVRRSCVRHTRRPDEIAVSGAFAFAGIGAEEIRGKTRQAFANGFLSLPGLGRATFVAVGEAAESEILMLPSRRWPGCSWKTMAHRRARTPRAGGSDELVMRSNLPAASHSTRC